MMRILLTLAICLFLSTAYAIQNGEVPGPDHPAAGNAVAVLSGSTNTCTGSIIAEDLILTAAHCLVDFSAEEIFVYFATPGELVYRDKSRLDQHRLRQAESYQVPGDYETRWSKPGLWGNSTFVAIADIGIIKLKEPMPTYVSHDPNFKFRALPIYLGTEVPEAGSLVDIAGFGEEGPRRFSSEHINRLTVGRLEYRSFQGETGHHVLSRHSGVQACNGDSGGPLYFQLRRPSGELEWAIAGIASAFSRWHEAATPLLHRIVGCNSSRDILYFAPIARQIWLTSLFDQVRAGL